MASLIFWCTVCKTERSIPLIAVPRDGLYFAQEINHPCTNCFQNDMVLDPAYPQRFVCTGVFLDGWGEQIEMIFSKYLN